MIRPLLLSLSLLLAAARPAQAPLPAQDIPAAPGLIPWPASARFDTARWMPGARIALRFSAPRTAEFARLRAHAREVLQGAFGVPVDSAVRGEVTISLVGGPVPARDREWYHLSVTPRGVVLRARTGAGVFYGLETLRQLAASPGNGAGRGLPGAEIDDRPRFAWRGLHLDVARHFFPVAFVKRYIDLMARYKYNTFHWHLTDDQGWRIPIRRYPRLTSVGGWRKETIKEKNFSPYVGDSTPYGGAYTAEEIREVVRYAAERYVTIVPEIEMPGHAKAALAAYPELACTPGPFEVGTVWGVEEDVFCPTETTFRFLENVLTEVMALFPGRYIHVGGDEVPKTRWRQSRAVQALKRREHLRDEEQVQSWFVRRIERFLGAHGRRLVGWDEILEGGIAPEATVMSWRGTAGGIAAAQAGHDVVMSPGSHVYFDHLQGSAAEEPLSIGGYTPLDKVYAFEPVPAELTPAQARHILGAQANLWTEYIATPAHAEYMVYPRALALSEVLWSPAAARDWRGFTERLPAALRALDQQRVNYRTPDVAGLEHDQVLLADSATVELRALMPGTIHYTLDGSTPDRSAPVYLGPLTLPLAPQGTVVTARLETPDGRLGGSRAATWRRAVYLDATRTDTAGLRPGLSYAYAEGRADSAAAVATLPVLRNGTVPTVRLRGDERAERFAVTLTGWLQVAADGLYDLALSSDDGSVLWLDGQVAVNNDGYHGADARMSTVALRPGLHALKVVMFQGSGAKVLGLSWRRAGEPSFSSIPASALFQGP